MTVEVFSDSIVFMLVIRLQRVGRKNDPRFRLVVTDSKNGPKSGKFVEILGSHNPRAGKPILKTERIQYWLSVGAKTSGTVHNMLVDAKIVEGGKINVLPKMKPIKKEEEAKEEKSPESLEVKESSETTKEEVKEKSEENVVGEEDKKEEIKENKDSSGAKEEEKQGDEKTESDTSTEEGK